MKVICITVDAPPNGLTVGRQYWVEKVMPNGLYRLINDYGGVVEYNPSQFE